MQQLTVNKIFQDRDGYLWVGTGYGLYRFDGDHFIHFKRSYRNPASLVDNFIQDICQDRDGNIWVGTANGISCFDPVTQTFKNIRTIKGASFLNCQNIVCDKTGTLWFSIRELGLVRYRSKANEFTVYKPSATGIDAPTGRVLRNSIVYDSTRHGLWMGTADGFNFLDLRSGQFFSHRNNPDKNPLFTNHLCSGLQLDGPDRIVFADNTDRRILIQDIRQKKTVREITLPDSGRRAAFPIITLLLDKQRNIWCSSWDIRAMFLQAGSYKPTELTHNPAHKTSISSNLFWSAWQHPDGSVWLGTYNGISVANPAGTFYRIHDLSRTIPDINNYFGVTSLAEGDSCWWVCTPKYLLRLDPVTNQTERFLLPSEVNVDYGYNLPQAVPVPNRQLVFVRHKTEVFLFDYRTKTFRLFPIKLRARHTQKIVSYILTQGDYIWFFGTFLAAVRYHLPTQTWEEFPLRDRLDLNRFYARCADIDRHGTVWLDAWPKGLFRFDPRQKAFVRQFPKLVPRIELSSNFVKFCIDPKGHIWCPGHGILEHDLKNSRFKLWTNDDGLPINISGAVTSDHQGNIWSVYRNQFTVFSPEKKQFRSFTLPLYDLNYEFYTYLITLRNGHVLSSNKGYLVEFTPNRLTTDMRFARVLVNSVSPPDTTYLVTNRQKPLSLGIGENNFSINYSVLNPSRTTYQYLYKLDGYDKNWVEAGFRTSANYTQIPGGTYIFRVKAVSGTSETTETTLLLAVDTEFYNKSWFRWLLGLIALGLVGAFWRYRNQQTSQVHQLQMQATRLERDKTDIQYQNLINQLNPHFLFNSLTSLNSLIVTEPKQASRFLQKLSAIYRYILQNKEKESVSLEHELNFVRHYIDLQKSRFDDGFEVELDVPDMYLQRGIVPVTLQNLLENAIKHNTVEEDKPLFISVFVAGEYLCVENTLQRRKFVETSNKQGLDSLKTLYRYLSDLPIVIAETENTFTVKVPMI